MCETWNTVIRLKTTILSIHFVYGYLIGDIKIQSYGSILDRENRSKRDDTFEYKGQNLVVSCRVMPVRCDVQTPYFWFPELL